MKITGITMKNEIVLGGGIFNKKIEERKIDPEIYKKKNIEILDYQYFDSRDDEEMNEEEEEIFEYFVNSNQGMSFCQYKIGKNYIQNAFEKRGIIGKILTIQRNKSIEQDYVGFILFESKSNFSLFGGIQRSLYLNLLCAISSKEVPERKGVPVGALLLKEMENYAIEHGYTVLVANAVKEAFPFYKKNGWKTVENKYLKKMKKIFKKPENDEIPIIKKLKIKKGGSLCSLSTRNSVSNNKSKTCMKLNSLKKIAQKLNKDERFNKYKDIDIKKYNKENKEKLVNKIKKKITCDSKLDFCILKKNKNFLNIIQRDFKPKGPIKNDEWLSSLDLINVMEHYENKYDDFEFIGPYPIDFKYIYDEFFNLNMKKLMKSKKKLGIIFNTDISTGPGQHWISLFLDLDNKTICYFDSAGQKPPKEIIDLLKELKKECKKNNSKMSIIINKTQFQFDNSSCGIWSLFHIISRLKGESCNFIYKSKKNNDKMMYKKRKEYFRN
mgnify:CR=1 FL=1